jgi:hypothetical protein
MVSAQERLCTPKLHLPFVIAAADDDGELLVLLLDTTLLLLENVVSADSLLQQVRI